MVRIMAEITFSLFAVFGLYAAVRLLFIYLFLPKEINLAVVVDRPLTSEEAAWMLFRARDAAFAVSYRRIVVLIDSAVENAEELMNVFTALGAACCIKNSKGGSDGVGS